LVHSRKAATFSPCPDGGINQTHVNNQESMILPIADSFLVEASTSLQGVAALYIGIFSSLKLALDTSLSKEESEKVV